MARETGWGIISKACLEPILLARVTSEEDDPDSTRSILCSITNGGVQKLTTTFKEFDSLHCLVEKAR